MVVSAHGFCIARTRLHMQKCLDRTVLRGGHNCITHRCTREVFPCIVVTYINLFSIDLIWFNSGRYRKKFMRSFRRQNSWDYRFSCQTSFKGFLATPLGLCVPSENSGQQFQYQSLHRGPNLLPKNKHS